MFRGLSDAASCLSPQFATTGHPRRSAGRRMHRGSGSRPSGLRLRKSAAPWGALQSTRGGSRFGRWFGKVLNGSRKARREGGARRPDPAGGGAEGTGASQAPPPSSSRLRLDVRPRRATVAGRQHRNPRPAARGGGARGARRREWQRRSAQQGSTMAFDNCAIRLVELF
jgi:hypothetical protein